MSNQSAVPPIERTSKISRKKQYKQSLEKKIREYKFEKRSHEWIRKRLQKVNKISTLDLTFANLIRWFGKYCSLNICRICKLPDIYFDFFFKCTNWRKKTLLVLTSKISFLSLEWLTIDKYSLHKIWYTNSKLWHLITKLMNEMVLT